MELQLFKIVGTVVITFIHHFSNKVGLVKIIVVCCLMSYCSYIKFRRILVVKLGVMPRLDKEMTMIQESLSVVHALMFQGLR